MERAGIPEPERGWTLADPHELSEDKRLSPSQRVDRARRFAEELRTETRAARREGRPLRVGVMRYLRDPYGLLASLVTSGRACAVGAPTVLLSGPVGGGKTALMTAAICDLVRAGDDVLMLPETDLLDGLKSDFDVQGTPFLARAKSVGLLAVDELGSKEAGVTDWQRGAIEDLLRARDRASLPTWATSNLPLVGEGHTLASIYGDRVASRLVGRARDGGGLFEVKGWEWRAGRPHT